MRCLALSRDAHAGHRHEAAYHALCAAMHAAHDVHDVDALRAVASEAEAQLAWIDANAREHRLSTASAAGHQHPGVYTMLVRQAGTYAEMEHHHQHAGVAAAARALAEPPAPDAR